MKRKLLQPAMFGLALLTLPLCGRAEPYVAVEGGGNWLPTQDLYQGGDQFVKLGFNSGYALGITGGWKFPWGLRPEFEFAYRRNDLDRFSARQYDGGGSIAGGGHEDLYLWHANLWYDYRAASGVFSWLHPYLGGGLGASRIAVRNFTAGGLQFGSAADTVFSYQAGAGLIYDIGRRFSLSADYRYVATHRGNFGSIPNIPPGDVVAGYTANTLFLSLRYTFPG